MSVATLLSWYRITFVVLLLVASVLTMVDHDHHGALLTAMEIVGALAFMWRRSQYIGAAILLGVFAFAAFLAIGQGWWATHLVQYAASVLFITAIDHKLSRSA